MAKAEAQAVIVQGLYGSKPSSTTLRSPDWLKMKNRTCAAVKDCREFMTVGGGP
jgi:hypothetical protein